jgi:glucoamylase
MSPDSEHDEALALAIEDRIPFTLHLGFDGWQRAQDRRTARTSLGELKFTRRHESGWERIDYRIELGSGSADALPEVFDDLPAGDAA